MYSVWHYNQQRHNTTAFVTISQNIQIPDHLVLCYSTHVFNNRSAPGSLKNDYKWDFGTSHWKQGYQKCLSSLNSGHPVHKIPFPFAVEQNTHNYSDWYSDLFPVFLLNMHALCQSSKHIGFSIRSVAYFAQVPIPQMDQNRTKPSHSFF